MKIEVVYKDGVFYPVEPVDLPEGTKGSVQLKGTD
jgi:predicted DNA-binding antitoxin AbrB/MazE fold protein